MRDSEILMSPTKGMEPDEAIKLVGGHHLYQLLLAILMYYTDSTGNRIAYTFPFMQSDKISYECSLKQSGDPYQTCDYHQACQSDLYDYRLTHTGLINWRVTYGEECAKKSVIDLLGSCYFAGYLAGVVIFLPLSDKLGRKAIVLAGVFIQPVASLIILLWKQFDILYIYTFILGMKMPMTTHLIFIWFSQFLTTKHRAIFSITGVSFLSLNNVWISFYFKYVGVWQYWYIGNAVEMVILTVLIWIFVPESPRSLIVRKHFKQAHRVLNTMARVNRKPAFNHPLKGELEDSLTSQSLGNATERPRCCDLFHQSRRRVALLFIIPVLWMAGDVSSYGIQYGLNSLSGSIYTNALIIGIADTIGQIMSGVLTNIIGRKTMIIIYWFLAAAGCIIYQLTLFSNTASYICIGFGRLGAQSAFILMYLITSESFPTAYKGIMFSISNVIARIGGIVSPILSDIIPHFTYFIGGLALIGFILSFWLIETKNLKMQETVTKRVK